MGVDQARRRAVVISSEGDPRTAAFIQSNLQLAFPDTRIIVARPEMFDRRSMLKVFSELPPISEVADIVKAFSDSSAVNEVLAEVGKSLKMTVNLEFWNDNGSAAQIVRAYVILLLSALFQLVPPAKRGAAFSSSTGISTEADALVGICGIPVHQITEVDAELVKKGDDLEAIRDLLRKLDTLQYFFPPPDQLALGLIDRAAPTTEALMTQLHSSIEQGHPYGPNELVPSSGSMTTMIENLQDKGYVMEGERTLEVTEAGKIIRETIKFKPRESVISKIVNQFSVKIDLKDFFK